MAVGEWDQRQLCPDGGCVGVIGPDGTCKVCGRAAPNWGDERKRGLIDPPDEDEQDDEDDDEDDDELAAIDGTDDDDDDDDEDDDDDDDDDDEDDDDRGVRAGESNRALGASSSGNWGSRRLCSDGTCIGVIGPNGRCKVCGRSASMSAEASGAAASTSHGASDDEGSDASAASGVSGVAGNASANGGVVASGSATGRVSCSDASCTGAIGADGHCDVCGKVAA